MLRVSQPFEHDLTAVDWSANGQFLVVGDRNGFIHTVNVANLEKMASEKSSLAGKKNAWVEDLKISPDNKYVCFGTHGGLSKLEVVEVKSNGQQLKRVKSVNLGLSSALTHLDWTFDATTVLVNSQGYELLWYNVAGQDKVNASATKGFEYATFTSLLGFPVQGIWPNPDYSDVNTTCRSWSQNILATGEDSGLVKLFRYPCVTEGANATEHSGHSSHVTKVKFTADDRSLVSVGGNDKTLIFWDTDFAMGGGQQLFDESDDDDGQADGLDDDDDFEVSRVDKAKLEK